MGMKEYQRVEGILHIQKMVLVEEVTNRQAWLGMLKEITIPFITEVKRFGYSVHFAIGVWADI